MKRLSHIIIGLSLLAGFASCQKSGLEPLSGKYPEAEQLKGQTLSNGGVTEQEGFNVFKLTSEQITLNLVSRNWYPSAGSYTVSSELGNSVLLASSTIEGKTLDHGGITVYKDGNDYEFSGTLWLADGTIAQIKANATLEYEEVIEEPEHYYTLAPYEDRGWILSLSDLSGNFAASFQVITASDVTGTYTVTADTENLKEGDAVVGFDLSVLIPGLIGGCYFDEDGSRWFISAGTVTVSGSEEMYSVFVENMVASNAAGEVYPSDSKVFANAIKPDPRNLVFEGWSCTYKSEDNSEAATTVHTLSLKNAEGSAAGQVVVTTNLLEGVAGTFQPAADGGVGYTAGMDLSAFGMGIIGSYVNVEGANQMITGGTMTISSTGGLITLTVTDLKSSLSNTASISFPGMTLTQEDPDVPQPPVSDSFEVKDGKYTYTSAPKEGVDGITEHTFVFSDAGGNAVGNFVCWTAVDAPAAGMYTYAAATETAIGSYAGGLDFFGMAVLGSYFVQEGVNYLINAGNAILTESDGKVSLLITDLQASATDGTVSSVTSLYFGDMTADTGEVPTLAVDGGKYTYAAAPKEGVDGITEHTYVFTTASGDALGSFVCWTATDAPAAGMYTHAAATETAVGSFAGGLDFFGIAVLGSYFVKDGVNYLINAGNAILVDNDGQVSLLVSDLQAAAADGTASDIQVLSFSNMTKAE